MESFEAGEMYTYSKVLTPDIKRKDKIYAAMYLRADRIYRTHQKQVYSIFEFLSDVGGFMGLLIGAIAFVFRPLLERMLSS